MRKIMMLTVSLLLLFSMVFSENVAGEGITGTLDPTVEIIEEEPGIVEDEESEGKADEQYNELGIEHGTMVFGEDISKLSEEELQYIPEGWRDGVDEDEHHHSPGSEDHGDHDHHDEDADEKTAMSSFFTTSQVYPNVNNRILSGNLKTATTEYNHLNFLTKFNYRYGRPEGVVAHETANNSSTITGEINWMSQNHRNAFVHAFVDHNRIIEVHDPNLGAWGGGRFANQRYIHVELVRVHTFDNFVSSMNNYSDYIATLLYRYNLGVVNADNNGQGTLWSHRAVSRFLGGTNHTDPYGYFERWGYNWNDFIALVTHKYNNMASAQEKSVNKLGHLKHANIPLYQNLNNLNSTSVAGTNLTNSVYYIKKEAVKNGRLYYLLSTSPSSTSGLIGWANANDISVNEHRELDKEIKNFYMKGTGSAYSKPWGGSRDFVYSDLKKYTNTEFKVDLTETVGSNIWYRGVLEGRTVWVHSSLVQDNLETNTSKLGHIRNASVILYPDYNTLSNGFTAGSVYTHAVYYIKKEAVKNGQLYYLLSNNPSSSTGLVGWARATDIIQHEHLTVDRETKTFYLTGTGSAFSKAWGGSKDFVHSDLSAFRNQEFKVHLTETVGNNVWYRGTLSGRTVWIHSNHLVGAPVSFIQENPTSLLGHLRNSSVRIYPDLQNQSNAITAGTNYTHAVYYIKKEAEFNGHKYYLLSKNPSSVTGVVGWAKAADLSVHPHVGVDRIIKTFYVKGTHSAFSKAWGGSKDLVFSDLSIHKNQEFTVNLTETVGNNVWYRGTLAGQTVWIHSNHVTIGKEVVTSKLGHIRHNGVLIYPDLSDNSSALTAGNIYTHAVYYIKKEATKDGRLYYLLSLNPSSTSGVVGWARAEDISALNHRGIDKIAKSFKIKGTGSAYTKAWGGRKDFAFPELTNFKNQEFKVHMTESVGAEIWYRGTLGGQTVWIHPAHLVNN